MKKQILILILAIMGINAQAQLEKGKHIVGVQLPLIVNDMYYTRLAFSSAENDYGISINPTYGYVIAHNWIIGIQATLGVERLKYYNSLALQNTETYTDLGIAPFTRYYVDISKKGKLKVFGVAAIEFNNANSKYVYNNSSNSFTGRSVTSRTGSLGGGIAWFGKKITIDASMSNTALRVGIYRVFSGRKK